MRILFVGLPRNVSHDLRHGRVANFWRGGEYSPEGFSNITITHPLKLLPDSVGVGRWVNQWMFRRHVRRVAKAMGMDRPVLWLNPHSAVHMAGRMGEAAVIYDITDDWTSFESTPAVMRRTRRQDEQLTRRADAVIVCSQRLYEMKKGLARRLVLIENGVNAEHYAAVLQDGPVPAGSESWEKPVFGYTGTVHAERVDVSLVEAIAGRMERGSLVFVGPIFLTEAERGRLKSTGRVHFIGPVDYADLPMYMRAIDVFIVPHRVTAFTESLNPIKLWEYLAAGKPIVSTDVAGFRDYSDLVHIAHSVDEFVTLMGKALHEELSLSKQRQDMARAHSWSGRVDQVVQVIYNCITNNTGTNRITNSREPCVA